MNPPNIRGVSPSCTPKYGVYGAVAEQADAGDLKSSGGDTPCGFDSRRLHFTINSHNPCIMKSAGKDSLAGKVGLCGKKPGT
jgi:hypothetical protein